MTKKVAVFRREHFNAAHRLFNPEWDDATNDKVFGKCALPNYHGHNYELEIKVVGKPSKETGYVMDMKELGDLVKREIHSRFDHKNLNLDVKGMPVMPSTENVAIFIWNILFQKIKILGAELHCIKLCETENNFVEYFGGK